MLASVQRAGITQGELALILKVSRVTVNNWLTGKNKPHKLLAEKVENLMKLVERAVQTGALPVQEGIDKNTRLAEIKKAIKAASAPS